MVEELAKDLSEKVAEAECEGIVLLFKNNYICFRTIITEVPNPLVDSIDGILKLASKNGPSGAGIGMIHYGITTLLLGAGFPMDKILEEIQKIMEGIQKTVEKTTDAMSDGKTLH